MRYLGLALVAEGSTDHRFLPTLLSRTVDELCRDWGTEVVEVGPVIELKLSSDPPSRAEKILAAVREVQSGVHLLFIHVDGAGDPDGAVRFSVDPVRLELARGLPFGHRRACGGSRSRDGSLDACGRRRA